MLAIISNSQVSPDDCFHHNPDTDVHRRGFYETLLLGSLIHLYFQTTPGKRHYPRVLLLCQLSTALVQGRLTNADSEASLLLFRLDSTTS